MVKNKNFTITFVKLGARAPWPLWADAHDPLPLYEYKGIIRIISLYCDWLIGLKTRQE